VCATAHMEHTHSAAVVITDCDCVCASWPLGSNPTPMMCGIPRNVQTCFYTTQKLMLWGDHVIIIIMQSAHHPTRQAVHRTMWYRALLSLNQKHRFQTDVLSEFSGHMCSRCGLRPQLAGDRWAPPARLRQSEKKRKIEKPKKLKKVQAMARATTRVPGVESRNDTHTPASSIAKRVKCLCLLSRRVTDFYFLGLVTVIASRRT
jgi:hypothetical protein